VELEVEERWSSSARDSRDPESADDRDPFNVDHLWQDEAPTLNGADSSMASPQVDEHSSTFDSGPAAGALNGEGEAPLEDRPEATSNAAEAPATEADDSPSPPEITTYPRAVEQAVTALAPIVQLQLNPAVAQYAANTEAGFTTLGRAVVDVSIARMKIQSHDDSRIVLGFRYNRVHRRGLLGSRPLTPMNVEAIFVERQGQWALERWNRVEML
jgi:hypothetical protein